MKQLAFIVMLFANLAAAAQTDSVLIGQSKNLHRMLVKKDFVLELHLDDQLSYGHSNGWIETKKEVLNSAVTYNSIVEDSMSAVISDKIGYVRFKGTYDISMNGKQLVLGLKVLEVWRKKKGRWMLFARQAVKI